MILELFWTKPTYVLNYILPVCLYRMHIIRSVPTQTVVTVPFASEIPFGILNRCQHGHDRTIIEGPSDGMNGIHMNSMGHHLECIE